MPAAQKKNTQLHALMVTHDQHLGEIYKRILSQWGIEIKVMSKVAKALVYLDEKKDRAVLLDADIPGEDALENVRELVQKLRTKEQQCIVFARRPTKEYIRAIIQCGAQHFFVILHTSPSTIARTLLRFQNN